MIDIHNHILPSVDDGASSLEESIAIAKIAVEQGISAMFATPHLISRNELIASVHYQAMTLELEKTLRENGIDLKLVAGAEVYPTHDVPNYLRNGYPITLGENGKYILLDSPLSALPMGLDEMVFSLQTMGYRPILAHPERASAVQDNPGILEDMVHGGLYLQLNGSSITSHSDSIRNTAAILLELNWVHFVASDAHSPRHRRPLLGRIYPDLVRVAGRDKADELVEKNGKCILSGEVVPSEPLPYKHRKRSWFMGLFHM